MNTNIFGIQISQSVWPMPIRAARLGRYVDLAPLSVDQVENLWPAVSAAPETFAFLRYGPFSDASKLRAQIEDLSNRAYQPFWAVLPKGGHPQGWLSICDIFPNDGSIEIGSIWFSPSIQGSKASREAIFLLMCHAMDELGYERLVWRCQAQNTKSFRAAESLGFTYEGTWRRAAVIDGWQRDVAWFSILREEWPRCKRALERWLAPENFDAAGRQIARLSDLREQA